ncbi:NADH dehydrogenase subunit 5 (mitochondrion) [Bos mutus]|uniref:NADH-ubiquinone oxidoreductase chain 5 n=3 Tax=Bos TaxID=9903 RepID=A0A097KZN4_9CETA|nr:NADH dehydrogenase subunit 5 [Bos grunniens]YP_009107157.1 NADH dehydrogenase subunit 5 [Bos mutus]QOH99512.1 NADH dehydrogenase subunit 5 [Bos grunniens x Bos taurus]ABP38011.1 NADH dehydrogenase subunit 5 [Bos grunniens]ABP38022.1 NADH dehydrogenase subunit 5 [Bos grunniens]ABP38035.1 NADH dehydrogenase subunit 5 [Bos grunniens]ACU81397.1 NADH dehydrogenase subunit 5 [Bos grunniens]
MNMFSSFSLVTLLLLTVPIMTTSLNTYKSSNYPLYVKTTISYAFITSMIPTMMFIYSGQELVISNWHWLTIQTLKLSLSFKMDYFSMMFVPVALFVTWSIMEFSMWYMHSDPNINKFFKYLLLFLITMMILVTANNLFQLFIGWEGVGIMSFLLIGWWYGRADANTAALQAVLYNRIGDIGFILAMAWFLTNLNTWDLQQIFMLDPNNSNTPLIGLVLAATGKSAQFGLHPWLPSAMEGPTPVSALLHSSTMVVAGIFLLIRFYPLTENNKHIQSITLCLGAITTLFTAMCALTQNDIKKIIAFSTSSQLGLMMVTIGINQPYLAFLHICTHAFFKAMLFMCSGSMIHSLNDEQDIRKMGGLFKAMPFTTTALIVGSLALTGVPFLTGFYSKDLIIEAANTSYTNAWALLMTLIATSFTAIYSTRIIFFALLGQPRFSTLININENNPLLINSIKRLLIGSLFAGYIISNNIPPTTVPQMTMPYYLKTTALIVTILGFTLALEISNMTKNLKFHYPSNAFKFSTLLGYFPTIMHRLAPYMNLSMSQKSASSLLDLIWLEAILPKTISLAQMKASTLVTNQKGLIKLYFLSFLITILISMILFNFHE